MSPIKSLRADLRAVEAGDPEGEVKPPPAAGAERPPCLETSPEAPALSLAAPRSGPTPKRRASNQTVVSGTDRDARLRHKPGHRPHLVHRAQVATDPKARVIVAVCAEAATGHEAGSLEALRQRARWGGNQATELCADQGYAARAVYQELEAEGVTAFIPPLPSMRHTPQGQAARRRCKRSEGVAATVDRMTHGEGAIAELKLRHALGRARCRGTLKLQVQLLVGATAVNLKRLAHPPPGGRRGLCGGRRLADDGCLCRRPQRVDLRDLSQLMLAPRSLTGSKVIGWTLAGEVAQAAATAADRPPGRATSFKTLADLVAEGSFDPQISMC